MCTHAQGVTFFDKYLNIDNLITKNKKYEDVSKEVSYLRLLDDCACELSRK